MRRPSQEHRANQPRICKMSDRPPPPDDDDDGKPSLPIRRRGLLTGSVGLAALGATAFAAPESSEAATPAALVHERPPAPAHSAAAAPGGATAIDLVVNGRAHHLTLDPRTSLLDALREDLGLTGTKKGCDHGQCGACTVHVDGRRVLSCLTLAAAVRGPVTTIEGLAAASGELHPMQQAFIDHDAFQCGYCTPGQIMSAVACINEGRVGSDAEIREAMSGNLCRCAAYPHIVAAVKQANAAMKRS
jgi:xanthine dehydrogenase YagT iron-sulfur-binding subunit